MLIMIFIARPYTDGDNFDVVVLAEGQSYPTHSNANSHPLPDLSFYYSMDGFVPAQIDVIFSD